MEDESLSRSEQVMRELTPDLWGEIGKCLTDTIDIQMFRSTSKTFRDLVPSPFPSIFPFPVSPLTSVSSDPHVNFYIIEHTGVLLKSDLNNNPCFLTFEKKPESDGRDFFAFRLFSNDHKKNTWPPRENPGPQVPIITWPPLETLEPRIPIITWPPRENLERRPINLDMAKLPVSVIFRFYYLYYRSTPFKGPIGENCLAQKVLLLSYFSNTNQCATDFNPQLAITEPGIDLSVVVLLKDGTLAHETLNNSTGWKLIASSSRFDDIIHFGGQLWGVDIDGGAYAMGDYISMPMTHVAEPPICITKITRDSWLEGRKRLVESCGKLYMLYAFSLIKDESVTEIMVFELNTEKGCRCMYEWVEVESIGNKSLFVGHGFSFSIVVGEELSNLIMNNSIYLDGSTFYHYTLRDGRFPFFKEMISGSTIGVYKLMDKKFSSISPDECPALYPKLHH